MQSLEDKRVRVSASSASDE